MKQVLLKVGKIVLWLVSALFLIVLLAFLLMQLHWYTDENQRAFNLEFKGIVLGDDQNEIVRTLGRYDYSDSGERVKRIPICAKQMENIEIDEYVYWDKIYPISYSHFYVIGFDDKKRVVSKCIAEDNL